MIGRKAYIPYGNQVIAIEIYAETPGDFTARTGIDLSNECVAQISTLENILDQVVERPVGPSVERFHTAEGIGNIVNRKHLMLSSVDLDDMIKYSSVSTKLFQASDIDGLEPNAIDYLSGTSFFHDKTKKSFQGFIEIPSKQNTILSDFNQLTTCSVKIINNKYFVPVHLFKNSEFLFDDKRDKKENGEWIVLYYGIDNTSYGLRFSTEDMALEYIECGFKAGYNPDILYYNS